MEIGKMISLTDMEFRLDQMGMFIKEILSIIELKVMALCLWLMADSMRDNGIRI